MKNTYEKGELKLELTKEETDTVLAGCSTKGNCTECAFRLLDVCPIVLILAFNEV